MTKEIAKKSLELEVRLAHALKRGIPVAVQIKDGAGRKYWSKVKITSVRHCSFGTKVCLGMSITYEGGEGGARCLHDIKFQEEDVSESTGKKTQES